MKTFSERFGFSPAKTLIQVDAIDAALRNALWSAVVTHYLPLTYMERGSRKPSVELGALTKKLWTLLWKGAVDTIPTHWFETEKAVRDRFYKSQWNEVYDFIEFVPTHFSDSVIRGGTSVNEAFIQDCNAALAREVSAYRFAGRTLVQITDDAELAAIDDARVTVIGYSSVREHLDTALRLLSDRETPDFRNSIKESISAVEAYCSLLTGQHRADLGGALAFLEKNSRLHPALKRAFGALYGFTSDAGGIRHALLDEKQLSFDDAKFMLVACSAFINYVSSLAAAYSSPAK